MVILYFYIVFYSEDGLGTWSVPCWFSITALCVLPKFKLLQQQLCPGNIWQLELHYFTYYKTIAVLTVCK